MRRLVAVILRSLGLLDFEIIAKRSSRHPATTEVGNGDLVHVVDGGLEKWACLRCPGGCGVVIPLSLNHRRRPAWSVAVDWFGRPTIKPSVHQRNECGCHFWITKGSVAWCEGGKPDLGDHRRI